jgi:hypothetical protein
VVRGWSAIKVDKLSAKPNYLDKQLVRNYKEQVDDTESRINAKDLEVALLSKKRRIA